jgi:hypothetical protein
MTTADAERYRRKAEECRANAKTATDDVDRAAWLRLAEDWMELAYPRTTDRVTARERNVREANRRAAPISLLKPKPSSGDVRAEEQAAFTYELHRYRSIEQPSPLQQKLVEPSSSSLGTQRLHRHWFPLRKGARCCPAMFRPSYVSGATIAVTGGKPFLQRPTARPHARHRRY